MSCGVEDRFLFLFDVLVLGVSVVVVVVVVVGDEEDPLHNMLTSVSIHCE
jgi:hypothetical protein